MPTFSICIGRAIIPIWQRKIINVANRLPVTVGEQIRKSSGGLVAALEGLPRGTSTRLEWIGWPGGVVEEDSQGGDRTTFSAAEFTGQLPSISQTKKEEGFYSGFSNSSLWPLLHYMADRMPLRARVVGTPTGTSTASSPTRSSPSPATAKSGLGPRLPAHAPPRLMLKEPPGLRIGFFLHTPFPSYEVFRSTPAARSCSAGMLGADLVGFHTPATSAISTAHNVAPFNFTRFNDPEYNSLYTQALAQLDQGKPPT